eukprot:TRINITY_DN2144_c0_g1_i7.p1 TRINITY_DN2144_c0_g1~~TRINITY_DN2144_c0_g1_i7.p1  ORF type:complete len:766 (-),score=154.62 TRINITY_DN2144_c0_g1_i7:71-2368(-)
MKKNIKTLGFTKEVIKKKKDKYCAMDVHSLIVEMNEKNTTKRSRESEDDESPNEGSSLEKHHKKQRVLTKIWVSVEEVISSVTLDSNYYPDPTVDDLKQAIIDQRKFRDLENAFPSDFDLKWDPIPENLSEPLLETYYECKDGDILDSLATLREIGMNEVNTNSRRGGSPVVVILKDIQTAPLSRIPSYGTLKNNIDYINITQIFSYREETVNELDMLIQSDKNLMITSPTFTGKTTLCHLLQKKISSRGLLTRSLNMIDCFRNIEINFITKLSLLFGLDMEKYLSSYDNSEEVPPLCIIIDEVQMTYPCSETLENQFIEEAEAVKPNDEYDTEINIQGFRSKKRFLEIVAYNDATSADIKRLIDVSSINVILFSAYGSGKGQTEISTPYQIPNRKYDTGKFKPLEIEELLESCNRRGLSRESYQFTKGGEAFDKIMRMTDGHVGYTFTILNWLCGKHLTCEKDVLLHIGSYSLYQLLLGVRASPDNTEVQDKTLTPYLLFIWTRKSVVYPYPDKKISDGLNRLVRKGLIQIQNDSTYELFCPLSVQIWLMNLFPQQGIPTDSYSDHDIEDFCWDVLRLISPPELAKTNSKTSELVINESIWQAEFYCSAKSLLQRDTLLSVEVSEIEENRSTGRVDFHINGTKHWGIELLIEGHKSFSPNKRDDFMIALKKKRGAMNRLAEHYHRVNNTYETFNFNHYLVIDFREQIWTGEETYDDDLEHIWIVYYQRDSEKGVVVTIGEQGTEPQSSEITFGGTMHTMWHELI